MSASFKGGRGKRKVVNSFTIDPKKLCVEPGTCFNIKSLKASRRKINFNGC